MSSSSPDRAVPPPDEVDPGVSRPLSSAVRVAAAGGRLESTLDEVVRAAVEHAGARYGALGVLTPDGKQLDRFVVVGTTEEDAERIGRLPSGAAGILRLLVDEPVPLRLDDLGAHPASAGLPPGHPPMHSFLGVPVRTASAVLGHLYLTEKRGGGGFTAADEEVVLGLAAAAGLAIENARLAEAAEQRRMWMQAGAAVITSLLSGTDPDLVLREVAERVAELSDADLCGVLVLREEDGEDFTVVAAAGEEGADAEGVRLPMAGTRLLAAHRAGVPLLLDDVTAHAEKRRYAPVVLEMVADGFGPAMVLPLSGPPGSATMVALRREGRPAYTPADLDLAWPFASGVGVALELARSRARQRDLEVAADRDRIARDLHDHVVQRIYATGLALDRISRSLQDREPDSAARIARRVDELDETIQRIRTAIFELHDDTGSGTGVRARLTEVVRSVTEGHGLRVDLRIRDGSEDLPADLVHDVVASVRELVTNVVRHAGATRVTVEVLVDGEVAVVVTDDGCGMPPITARSGLANLADRAERRGGRMVVTAGPPGTAVRWAVPRLTTT